MRTRKDWAERPLAERKIAAEEWCHGWNDARAGESPERCMVVTDSNVIDHFALDLPDQPAPDRDVRVVAAVRLMQDEAVLSAGNILDEVERVKETLAAIDAARRPA